MFKLRGITPIPLLIAVLAVPYRFSMYRPDTDDVLSLVFIIGGGLCIMAAGEALRIVSVAFSSPSTRTRNVKGSRLFSSGPYAYIRNPLYLGNFFIMSGALVMSWTWFPWLQIAAAVFFVIQYYFIIKLEENVLKEDLGEEYEHYRKHVPCIVPGQKPYRHGAKEPPDFVKAIKSEKPTLRAEVFITVLIAIRWYIILH